VANALFRCDGGPHIGLGHVVRCRALAAAFETLGWRCWFAMTRETARLLAVADAIVVPAGIAGAPAVNAAVTARKVDCLVVDHYRLDATFERAARGGARLVLAIDDLADRRHDCDLVVDPNPERTAGDYARHVGRGTQFLLGPRHALLRPQFAERRAPRPRAPRRNARRLLITLGGADPENLSARVLAALPSVPGEAPSALLVVGPAHRQHKRLVIQAAAQGVDLVIDPPDMADVMAQADMAVTAGGTSCWELACLGIPMLLIVTADNQRGVARALAAAGAALVLGDSHHLDGHTIADAIGALAGDRELRRRMALAGRKLVDGRGANRVAGVVAKTIAARAVAAREQEICL
jgi:UDP-2,4-diacetamido-2,4,6-trideoxy-beta-L-altropyranose hydrolase